MYKNNSLNLFLNTESDNSSSTDFNLSNILNDSSTTKVLNKSSNNLSETSDMNMSAINKNMSAINKNNLSETSEISQVVPRYIKPKNKNITESPFMKSTQKNNNKKREKQDYLINTTISDMSPLSSIEIIDNKPVINTNVVINSNDNLYKERTVNLNNIISGFIGFFTYFFSEDKKDDDSDLLRD